MEKEGWVLDRDEDRGDWDAVYHGNLYNIYMLIYIYICASDGREVECVTDLACVSSLAA